MVSKVQLTVKQMMKIGKVRKDKKMIRKVKKLKRSWSYLKESSQILEPSSNSRKMSPRVIKNTTKFKNKKRGDLERRSKKITMYKEVNHESNKKAEKNLKQENCGEEVMVSKNAVYI